MFKNVKCQEKMKLLHYNSQSVDHANIRKHESVHVFNALALSCFTFDYFNPCQQVIRHRMTTLPAGLSHAYNYTHSLSQDNRHSRNHFKSNPRQQIQIKRYIKRGHSYL